MTQREIDDRLVAAAEEKYRDFNARIVRSQLPMIGVRAPVLQALAKEIARDSGDFFTAYKAHTYEQILLYALALAKSKMPFAEKVPYLDGILPKFDNWAHVDMTLGAFGQLKKHRAEFLEKYARLAEGGEFEQRFLVVFLMDYCLTEEWLPTVWDWYARLQGELYYVNMGIAWGLSVALVKFYEPTLACLKKGGWNDFVLRKTVQKARESYRISPERKEELKRLL